MSLTVKAWKQVDVEVAAVRIVVPVRYDEEDIPNNFPGRIRDTWSGVVDFDGDGTATLRDWPEDYGEAEMHMKVVDGGVYCLLDSDDHVVASIEQDYVPHGVVPGSYGDYIELSIAADGTVTNWKKHMEFSKFFRKED